MANEANGGYPYLPSGPAEVDQLIKEHSDLFSDTQCKVCSAVLISDSQKQAHYQSRKHANKVRRYLNIHKEDSLLVKRLKTSTEEKDDVEISGDRTKACPICNMVFTTPVIAQAHYQGKVHAKNLKLRMTNANAAKKALPHVEEEVTPDGTMQALGATATTSGPEAAADVEGAPGGEGAQSGSMTDRFCGLCNANFNNPLMAHQHYVGKKHQKHMAKRQPGTQASTTASTVKGYPCKVCNIELNSQKQYEAHISGAKHKHQTKLMGGGQAAEAKPSEGSTLPPEVSVWSCDPQTPDHDFQFFVCG